MASHPNIVLRSLLNGWLIGVALTAFSLLAQANAIWPPAVYFYTRAVWWVVALGLLIELVVHLFILRMPPVPLIRMVLASNVASTLVGFILLWPVAFWESGVERLAAMAPASIFAVLGLIFALNTAIEYTISVCWLEVPKSKAAIGSFVLANALSYGLVVGVALSGILSGI